MTDHIKIYLSLLLVPFLLAGCQTTSDQELTQNPNILILYTDDMGYGDLSSYGHPNIQTPRIDRLADQGIRFTNFLTGNWCVPSRTQLLTGRYYPRVNYGGRMGANGKGGMPDEELTLAEGLKQANYVTGMAGKWHLGHAEDKFLPVNQGFDSWYGMPYSNDFRKPWVQTEKPLALYRGTEMVEHPVNQDSLTVRYTEEAVRFIRRQSANDQPFFFYFAYNMPHLPVRTTKEFRGRSPRGLYGDVIETIDWSVGRVLDELERQGVTDNTIVFFASDNGPWIHMPPRMQQEGNKRWHAGSPGLFRGSKATTYEGGHRVPAIIRWPNRINANQVSSDLVASPDIYRTLLEVAGVERPPHPLDGYNLLPLLTGQTDKSPREEYAYFHRNTLQAMRIGDWKLRLAGEEPELFNVEKDPSERYNRAQEKPEKVKQISKKMRQFINGIDAELPDTTLLRK